MLLIVPMRPDRKDGVWTAIDPTGRISLIDTKNKDRVYTRPVRGVEWADHRGLSPEEQAQAQMKSDRMIERNANDNIKDAKGNNNGARRRSNRSKAAWWMFDLTWSGSTALWARRH